MSDQEEKGLRGANTNSTLPTYEKDAAAGHHEGMAPTSKQESWVTRNGLNAQSFQKREYGRGIIELDRSMKTRHLHMIAIGKLCWPPPCLSSQHPLTAIPRWLYRRWLLRRFWRGPGQGCKTRLPAPVFLADHM